MEPRTPITPALPLKQLQIGGFAAWGKDAADRRAEEQRIEVAVDRRSQPRGSMGSGVSAAPPPHLSQAASMLSSRLQSARMGSARETSEQVSARLSSRMSGRNSGRISGRHNALVGHSARFSARGSARSSARSDGSFSGRLSGRLGSARSSGEDSLTFGSNPLCAAPPEVRRFARNVMKLRMFSGLVTALTVFALFADDIRIATTTKGADPYFSGVSALALFMFTSELILSMLAHRGYLGSFYFWLDLAATVSLVTDVMWISEALFEAAAGGDSGDDTSLLRAGRASRAATRAGRIVRIVRLVRLVRLVKLYKQVSGGAVEEDPDEEVAPERDVDVEPSKVSKKMSELTTRRVIMLVLSMLLALPAFDGLDEPVDPFPDLALGWLHRQPQDQNTSWEVFSNSLTHLHRAADPPLLYIDICSQPKCAHPVQPAAIAGIFREAGLEPLPYSGEQAVLDVLRATEINAYGQEGCYTAGELTSDECISIAYTDGRGKARLDAWLNLAKTVFIMIILSVGSVAFAGLSDRVILHIERMVVIIKRLAKNPLDASVSDEKRSGDTPAAQYTVRSARTDRDSDDEDEHGGGKKKRKERAAQPAQGFEVRLLETTIKRISGLLQIGFGEAGADIIKANMADGGQLETMLPGKKVEAIIGFCNIREFGRLTDVLQEDIMHFVNSVACIVHGAVHEFRGSCNRNLGEGFLVFWKIPRRKSPKRRRGGRRSSPHTPIADDDAKEKASLEAHARYVSQIADDALGAFIKSSLDMIQATRPGGLLAQYAIHPGLVGATLSPSSPSPTLDDSGDENGRQHLSSLDSLPDTDDELTPIAKRPPPRYTVKMGYGLHYGWAIEGAIGSGFKIDASYLSPHVNLAARLQAASQQYGVAHLISEGLHAILSEPAKRQCRLVDRVTVKGSQRPLSLYTVDLTDTGVRIGSRPAPGVRAAPSHIDFEDDSFQRLARAQNDAFVEAHNHGVTAYMEGSWDSAIRLLTKAIALKGEEGDPPSTCLVRFIEDRGRVPPTDWVGFRALTTK